MDCPGAGSRNHFPQILSSFSYTIPKGNQSLYVAILINNWPSFLSTSFFDVQGRRSLASSSAISRNSLNLLNYWKLDCVKKNSFLYTSFSTAQISVVIFPSFTRNLRLIRCSIWTLSFSRRIPGVRLTSSKDYSQNNRRTILMIEQGIG